MNHLGSVANWLTQPSVSCGECAGFSFEVFATQLNRTGKFACERDLAMRTRSSRAVNSLDTTACHIIFASSGSNVTFKELSFQ